MTGEQEQRGQTTHASGPQDVTANDIAKGIFKNPFLLILGAILLAVFKPIHATAILLFAVGVGLLLFYPSETITAASESYAVATEQLQSAFASVDVPELTRQLGFVAVVLSIVTVGMGFLLYWMVKNNPDGPLSADHDFEEYKDAE